MLISKQEEQNRQNAQKGIVFYLLQELAANSAYDIDNEEMEEWTQRRAKQTFEYMLEAGEDPRLPEEGFEILSDEEAIAKIAKGLDKDFKQMLLCRKLCEQKGVQFTIEDVKAEIQQQQLTEEVDEDAIKDWLEDKYLFAVLNDLTEGKAMNLMEGR